MPTDYEYLIVGAYMIIPNVIFPLAENHFATGERLEVDAGWVTRSSRSLALPEYH